MSTTVEEYVEDLVEVLGRQQGDIGNKLVNGQFATLEEAKTLSGQVRGLEVAKTLARELYKNRNLAEETGETPLGDVEGNPGGAAPKKAARKRGGSVRGGKPQ